uniref:Ribosomal protein L7 like 1 n=1 Tax=Xenopus tropicalis TaxID=8364 RepID=A0A803JWE9_XENTR
LSPLRPRKLPRVPENLLKKRKKYLGLKAAEAKRALEEKRKTQPGKQIKFKRLETFVRNSHRKLRDDARLKRMKIYQKKIPGVATQSLAFVVLSQLGGVSRLVLHSLTSHSLGFCFSRRFPNLKSIRELVLKRGHFRRDGRRVALTDNNVIEEQLGKFGIICLEDVIHELYTTGEHFPEVNRFLCPFRLSVSRHAAVNRKGYLSEVGDPGHRGSGINQLIRQLN